MTRAIFAALSGILAVVLAIVAGLTDPATNGETLRKLSIGFGATITLLQIVLVLFLELFIAAATVGKTQEDEWRNMIKSTEPSSIVVSASKVMLDAIDQLKRARDLLDDGATKTALTNQIAEVEKAFGPLGTDQDPKKKPSSDPAENA